MPIVGGFLYLEMPVLQQTLINIKWNDGGLQQYIYGEKRFFDGLSTYPITLVQKKKNADTLFKIKLKTSVNLWCYYRGSAEPRTASPKESREILMPLKRSAWKQKRDYADFAMLLLQKYWI
jgi:hypothetical protein